MSRKVAAESVHLDRIELPPIIPAGMTMEDGQNYVIANVVEGGECPCCGRVVKLYPRNINNKQTLTLIWLVRHFANVRRWVHAQNEGPKFVSDSREIGKLRHWGLVKQRPKREGDPGKTSGLWKPTKKGGRFVRNKIALPKYAMLFNNVLIAYSEETVRVADTLEEEFNYDKLMRMRVSRFMDLVVEDDKKKAKRR